MRKSASHHSTGMKKGAGTAPSASPDGIGAPAGESQIVLYRTLDGGAPVEVRLVKESVWLTQKQMAVLFDTERSVITKHLRNVFATGELGEKGNVQKMHIPGSDTHVAFYHFEAIFSVGHRVNSRRGTTATTEGSSVDQRKGRQSARRHQVRFRQRPRCDDPAHRSKPACRKGRPLPRSRQSHQMGHPIEKPQPSVTPHSPWFPLRSALI